jgi:hypothetical protein
MQRTRYRETCFHILFLSIAVMAVALSIGCCPRHENPFLHGLGLKQFVQRGPTEVYNRDNIFDYMNGEADVYLPLGFSLLYTERYRKPGTGKLILVEVYDMGSSNGAEGVFDAYSRKGGRRVEGIGSAAWTDNSLILFWRSKYFFRVAPDPSAQTDAHPDLKDLFELSRNIDQVVGEIYQQ